MDNLRALLPSRPSIATLKRNKKRTSNAPVSSALSSATETNSNDSKIKNLMAQWKKLDENLASFERLEAMRSLVAKGEMSTGAYDMLHDLSMARATGKTRKPSVTGITAFESPIMAGYLYLRTGKTWKKKYVLLFTERLEYFNSKQESETNRGNLLHPSSLLVLTERFFVSDSTSRRLVNQKEHGFMISDFVTTHYYAADTRDLAQYWMHILAKTIKKIQEAKAFFEQRPRLMGRAPPKSSEAIEQEYQDRLSSYQNSRRSKSRDAASTGSSYNNKLGTAPITRDQSSTATGRQHGRQRESLRLKAEAEALEQKLQEHALLQIEFEEEAAKAEETVERLQKEMEESNNNNNDSRGGIDPTERQEKEMALKEAEALRVEMEERALLEAKMVVEYEELVEETQEAVAEAEAQEQVEKEIKRRSVALLPVGASADEIEKLLAKQEENKDSPEALELKNTAIEAVVKRTEEEQEAKIKEADEAIQTAKETYKQAEEARVNAQTVLASDPKSIDNAIKKVQEGQAAEELAKKAAQERDIAIRRAEALHRQLSEARAALERSKQQAAARMGTANKKPLPSQVKKEDPQIQTQIDRLVGIIKRIGDPSSGGGNNNTNDLTRQTTFGNLCKEYEKDVAQVLEEEANSSTAEQNFEPIYDVVGLLVRAKRLGVVDYEGGNLFRGTDEGVLIKTL